MKIAVAVKQVGALQDDFELRDDELAVEPGSLEWELNEWDRFSVEAALQLRDEVAGDDSEVLVVTVGPEESDDGLLECLGMGADRAVRIWDDRLAPPTR